MRNQYCSYMIKEEKKYDPTRNYDRFNVHKIYLLTMWCANVDRQLVLYWYVALKYLSKYASKAEKRFEIYHDMLTRISNYIASKDHDLFSYRRFPGETIVNHDIGAQETCHMFLNLHLVGFSQKFVSLNAGRKVFRKISRDGMQFSSENNFFNIIRRDLSPLKIYL